MQGESHLSSVWIDDRPQMFIRAIGTSPIAENHLVNGLHPLRIYARDLDHASIRPKDLIAFYDILHLNRTYGSGDPRAQRLCFAAAGIADDQIEGPSCLSGPWLLGGNDPVLIVNVHGRAKVIIKLGKACFQKRGADVCFEEMVFVILGQGSQQWVDRSRRNLTIHLCLDKILFCHIRKPPVFMIVLSGEYIIT